MHKDIRLAIVAADELGYGNCDLAALHEVLAKSLGCADRLGHPTRVFPDAIDVGRL